MDTACQNNQYFPRYRQLKLYPQPSLLRLVWTLPLPHCNLRQWSGMSSITLKNQYGGWRGWGPRLDFLRSQDFHITSDFYMFGSTNCLDRQCQWRCSTCALFFYYVSPQGCSRFKSAKLCVRLDIIHYNSALKPTPSSHLRVCSCSPLLTPWQQQRIQQHHPFISYEIQIMT